MSDELIERVARALAKADSLDYDEVCGVDADPDNGYCDSGTCIAAHWEDHDAEQARRWYLHLSRAAIAAMQADGEPVADERAVCIARAVDYAVANWSLVTAELKASRLEEVLGRYGMKIVVDDRVSPPTSVDDSETGNTSDKPVAWMKRIFDRLPQGAEGDHQ